MLLLDVPDELTGRGIFPATSASGFAITLDRCEPWGGGRVEGRVERRGPRRSGRGISITVRCEATWLDIAPQLVGQKRLWRLDTYWELRTRGIPIWIPEEIWSQSAELGSLTEANWLQFRLELPADLPRAFEGTFASFRWRIEARRRRPVGHSETSLPLLLREPRELPVVRVEKTPLGEWRLLEWKSDGEVDGEGGGCSVSYEDRRPEDMPR